MPPFRRVGKDESVDTTGGTTDRGDAHVTPGQGRTWRLWGERVTGKVSSARTGGAFSLFEVASAPGAGPPPHVQHREDEVFWVLLGRYEFRVEDELIEAGAGSLVYVRRGRLHTHRNVGDGPGRMLVAQTPGGLHERFFAEVGEPADGRAVDGGAGRPYDPRSVADVAAGYGIEIRPPAPARAEPGPDGAEPTTTGPSRPPSRPTMRPRESA